MKKPYNYEIPFMGELKKYLEEKHKENIRIVRGNSSNESGISDLLMCYKGFFVAIETKTGTDLSPLQSEFIAEIRTAGGRAEEVNDQNWKERVDKIFSRIDDFICFYGIS